MTSSRAQPLPAPPNAATPEAGPGAAVVRVRDLRMRYGDAEPVVDRVSLDVAEGQVVSLIGPSGSGKSTVLRAMAGLHRPDGGAVEPDRPVTTRSRAGVDVTRSGDPRHDRSLHEFGRSRVGHDDLALDGPVRDGPAVSLRRSDP